MRSLVLAAALAPLLFGPAVAETTASTGTPATPDLVCLSQGEISRTSSPDDKTILYFLKSGKIWRNALVANCPALSTNGFSYEPAPKGGKVCGNLQSIQVKDTKETCILGPFTEETPKGTDTAY